MAKKSLYNKINRHELKKRLIKSDVERTTLSFYKYASIQNPCFFRNHLYELLSDLEVLGRIYVAKEGINAQISVPDARIEALKMALNEISFLQECRLNMAIEDDGRSFFKLTIKVRDKIVADGLGNDDLDMRKNARHINAREFNKLADTEDIMVIDMRNHYESEVGHFEGAVCPNVETFRESLPIVEKILDANRDKQIIMYCTGGIRCEKATAYYMQKGYDNLLQLDGGIIEYSRQTKEFGLSNKFIGKNFVFDDRLGERISSEIIAKCHQCGSPNDHHVNCANDACHLLFIQCNKCREKYQGCCSAKCQEFNSLPEEKRKILRKQKVFNGTRFGKGRYRAHQKNNNELVN